MSKKINILITGSSGFLGSDMLHTLSKSFQCRGIEDADLPLTDKEKVMEIIVGENPDIIIHAAGCDDILFCEDNPQEAFRINALGTRNIALATAEVKAQLVYMSTGRVFSGKKGAAYYEFDRPDPACVYGLTKSWGEYYVSKILDDYFIIRVPLLFGLNHTGKDNILKDLLQRASDGEEIRVLQDQIINPTWARHVSHVTRDLIATESFGIYHVGNTGAASLQQFYKAVLEEDGLNSEMIVVESAHDDGTSPLCYNVLQSASLPYLPAVKKLPDWRGALSECFNIEG